MSPQDALADFVARWDQAAGDDAVEALLVLARVAAKSVELMSPGEIDSLCDQLPEVAYKAIDPDKAGDAAFTLGCFVEDCATLIDRAMHRC